MKLSLILLLFFALFFNYVCAMEDGDGSEKSNNNHMSFVELDEKLENSHDKNNHDEFEVNIKEDQKEGTRILNKWRAKSQQGRYEDYAWRGFNTSLLLGTLYFLSKIKQR